MMNELSLIFADPADLEAWLNQPNAHLGGRTPNQAIADGDSDRVHDIIKQILYIGIS